MLSLSILLAEFDDEIAATRSVLDRLPEAAFAWKPHERSMSLGGLATHLAQIPHWGDSILQRDGYDLQRNDTEHAPDLSSRADVVSVFDRHAAEVRQTLLERPDAELTTPWALTSGGHLIMSMPKISALRRFLLNHLVHHRGQMTVYLRLQNVPLPPLYGPTADETCSRALGLTRPRPRSYRRDRKFRRVSVRRLGSGLYTPAVSSSCTGFLPRDSGLLSLIASDAVGQDRGESPASSASICRRSPPRCISRDCAAVCGSCRRRTSADAAVCLLLAPASDGTRSNFIADDLFACGVWALAAVLGRRFVRAAAWTAAATCWHPTTAFWFGAAIGAALFAGRPAAPDGYCRRRPGS